MIIHCNIITYLQYSAKERSMNGDASNDESSEDTKRKSPKGKKCKIFFNII